MLKKLLLLNERKHILEKLEEKRNKKLQLEEKRSEFEKAINEIKTDEERAAVTKMVEEFENEVNENNKESEDLEKTLQEIDGELKSLEENEPEINSQESSEERNSNKDSFERGEVSMERGKYFAGLTRAALNSHVKREEVSLFIQNVRSKITESRSVKGSELLIPSITLELIRDDLHNYSKLIKYVNLKKISGKARQNIMGVGPEAIWIELRGKINELDFDFSFVEIDGYKVAGFVPICNSTLEDSDEVDLYNEILYVLSQAIGLAIDKAIIYGTGKKMPLGIVTRLAQSADPNLSAPIKGLRKWEDLHTSNVVQLNDSEDAKVFFSELIKTSGKSKANYSKGNKVWVMSEATKTSLMAKAITFDSSGTIVSNINNTMPIVGGNIEILDFMKDGDIVGGYFDLYLLGERAGGTFAVSEHAQFIEDNTVFKGTARYDGQPVIAEGFVAINIKNTSFTTTLTFGKDKANGEL